jgi:hypothetical protein
VRLVRVDTGTEIPVGAEIVSGITFRGIIDEPKPMGNAGGPFSGRILVTDSHGNDSQPLPFQYNVMIVP